MRRLVCGFATVLVALGASADMLNLKSGTLLKGTLREVTFSSAGGETKHQRDELKRIELSSEGDKITLDEQLTLEGKLIAVTFDATDGRYILARNQLSGLALDDATTLGMLRDNTRPPSLVIRNDRAAPSEEGDKELSDEQREALKLNLQLYKQYMAKAEKEEDAEQAAVKNKYMPQVKQVLSQISDLQRRIAEKERRRREARARDALYRQRQQKGNKDRKRRNDNRGHEYERLVRTDGLEKDRRALRDAWAKAAKLRDTIRPLLREIGDRYDALEDRIRQVARLIRASILEGDIPPRDQMVKGYEGAFSSARPAKGKRGR